MTHIWIATFTVKIGAMQLLIRWEYASKELCIGPRIYLEKRNFVCINPLHVYFICTWNKSLRFEISKSFLPRKRKFCSLWYFQNNKQYVSFISNRSNIAMSRRIYCDDFSTSYKAHVEDCNFLLHIFVAYIQTIAKHRKLAYFVSYYPLSSYEFKNSMCHRQ